jgi:hypothetical protein
MPVLPTRKNPSSIYVVTTLQFGFKYINRKRSGDGKYHSYEKRISPSQKEYFTIVRERTWGWYSTLDKAKEAVEKNYGDMYENDYNYAVIERTPEGILWGGDIPKEWWYKWQGSWEKGKYVPWKKPSEYDTVIGFMSRIRQIKSHWGLSNEKHQ